LEDKNLKYLDIEYDEFALRRLSIAETLSETMIP
jgi:hypothetical protein